MAGNSVHTREPRAPQDGSLQGRCTVATQATGLNAPPKWYPGSDVTGSTAVLGSSIVHWDTPPRDGSTMDPGMRDDVSMTTCSTAKTTLSRFCLDHHITSRRCMC
jgi:hypothetical protein